MEVSELLRDAMRFVVEGRTIMQTLKEGGTGAHG